MDCAAGSGEVRSPGAPPRPAPGRRAWRASAMASVKPDLNGWKREIPAASSSLVDLDCQLLQLGKGCRWDPGWDLQIGPQRLRQVPFTGPPGRERSRVRAQPRVFTKAPLT